MFYSKPKDVTYTDMAIYVDNNVYKEDCDEDTIFKYLFFLAQMLARKKNLFSKARYYDDFAIYMATRTYMRYKNPKQYILQEDGTPKMKKVKSSLNFMKSTLYPCKVDFEQTEYAQVMTSGEEDYDNSYDFSLINMIAESSDELNLVEFELCLGDVIKTMKNFLSQIPYYKDKETWDNIYISCLLSYLNSVTLPDKTLKRISELKYGVDNRPLYMENLYRNESLNSAITFHIDDSMKNYIQTLTNEMKHVVSKDLSLDMHEYIPTHGTMDSVVWHEINGEDVGNED